MAEESRREASARDGIATHPDWIKWTKLPLEQLQDVKFPVTFDGALGRIMDALETEADRQELQRAVAASRAKVENCEAAGLLSRGEHLRGPITRDQACALVLYTALAHEDGGSTYAYYRQLNHLLRECDARVAVYMPMVFLMTLAMQQLTPVPPCAVFRGVRLPPASKAAAASSPSDDEEVYTLGASLTWHAFSSTTRTLKQIEAFSRGAPTDGNADGNADGSADGSAEEGSHILFQISCASGVDLSIFSLHPDQDEVLIPSGTTFAITQECAVNANVRFVLMMESSPSPHSILHYTPPPNTRMPAPAPLPPPPPAPPPVLSPFYVSRYVGPRPTDRTWRDEWPKAYTEDRTMANKLVPAEASLRDGGENSPDAKLAQKENAIEWKVAAGWAREAAEAYTVLAALVIAPIARALAKGRRGGVPCTDYAASTHTLCDALVSAARLPTTPAPPCYRNLSGLYGLADQFDEWRALLPTSARAARAGTSFVTSGVATAYTDPRHFDSSLSGGAPGTFAVAAKTGKGEARGDAAPHWHAQDESDVVEFRSAATDAHGYHTLIPVTAYGAHQLPPMATVEVVEVKAPGTWSAHGVTGARRLFVVRVAYALEDEADEKSGKVFRV